MQILHCLGDQVLPVNYLLSGASSPGQKAVCFHQHQVLYKISKCLLPGLFVTSNPASPHFGFSPLQYCSCQSYPLHLVKGPFITSFEHFHFLNLSFSGNELVSLGYIISFWWDLFTIIFQTSSFLSIFGGGEEHPIFLNHLPFSVL